MPVCAYEGIIWHQVIYSVPVALRPLEIIFWFAADESKAAHPELLAAVTAFLSRGGMYPWAAPYDASCFNLKSGCGGYY
jgi:hypothetical protein